MRPFLMTRIFPQIQIPVTSKNDPKISHTGIDPSITQYNNLSQYHPIRVITVLNKINNRYGIHLTCLPGPLFHYQFITSIYYLFCISLVVFKKTLHEI